MVVFSGGVRGVVFHYYYSSMIARKRLVMVFSWLCFCAVCFCRCALQLHCAVLCCRSSLDKLSATIGFRQRGLIKFCKFYCFQVASRSYSSVSLIYRTANAIDRCCVMCFGLGRFHACIFLFVFQRYVTEYVGGTMESGWSFDFVFWFMLISADCILFRGVCRSVILSPPVCRCAIWQI